MKVKFFDNLSEDFIKLLENSDEYNVVIEVGELPLKQSFKVHSTILCYRFPQLYNELKTIPYNQHHRKIIQKPNISGKLFMIIINYIYGGFINLEKVSIQQVFDLMLVAKDFQLEELSKNIESYLVKDQRSWLSLNIFKVYNRVFQSNDFTLLRSFCNDMIAKRPEVVFKSSDFFNVEERVLISILKQDNLQLPETEIWEHVLRWGKFRTANLPLDPEKFTDSDFQNLKDTLQNCLPYIRFFHIPSGDIYNRIKPYSQVLGRQLWDDILSIIMVPQKPIASNILPPRKILTPSSPVDSMIKLSPHISHRHQGLSPRQPVSPESYKTRAMKPDPYHTKSTRPELPRPLLIRRPFSISTSNLGLHELSMDDKKSVKLYVKALYDYKASSREEISFKAGDVIAVFHTNADGWWEGELDFLFL